MKFLFLARVSPEVKTVSQIYREKTDQNNERIKIKIFLMEVRNFLLRGMENMVNQTGSSGHGRAEFNSTLRKQG